MSGPFFLGALNPAVALDHYLISRWTVADGLPQNSVRALIQDHAGYIWLATPSGLVRFDGVRFRNFNRWSNAPPGLLNDDILCLYADRQGALWVGTGGGLFHLQGNRWQSWTRHEGLADNVVQAITQDAQGNLWIGTASGLGCLKKGIFRIYRSRDGLCDDAVTALAADGTGIWVGTPRGLNRLAAGTLSTCLPANGQALRGIKALTLDRTGALWIGSEIGLYRLQDDRCQPAPAAAGFAYPVSAICQDAHGTLWLGMLGGGLARLRANGADYLSSFQGFPDDFISALLEDAEGNLWIGTAAAGLLRLKERRAERLDTVSGLPENVIYPLLGEGRDILWAGTRNRGLLRLKNLQPERLFTRNDGLASERIRVLCPDGSGGLWIGTQGGGLNRLRAGRITPLADSAIPANADIRAVCQTGTGEEKAVWVGTSSGLYSFRKEHWSRSDAEVGLPVEDVRTMLVDRQGRLWVGTAGGLYVWEGERFLPAPAPAGRRGLDVLALCEDHRGALWIGIRDLGLLRLEAGRSTLYGSGQGLADTPIFCILEDGEGNIWTGSYSGVSRLERIQLDALAAKKIARLTPLTFDENDGMGTRECTAGGQPPAWRAADGRLFFPTLAGIAVFDPDAITVNRRSPPVVIEDLIADNRSHGGEEDIRLPAGTRMLEFYFTALSLIAPGKIRFKYKLEGLDGQWQETEPGQQRTALYLNLAPGPYRFRVIASNNDGLWNETGASLEFRILPPFQQRTVFFLLVFLAVALLVGTIVLRKRRQRARKLREKYRTSALRAEQAEEIFPRLTQLVERERIYLDETLTLQSLAGRLGIHANHLSRIINERVGQNFNDFVNRYRIEEAKRRLLEPEGEEPNILGIALEVGFNSKSVFNTAFKKFTGLTPSRYRQAHAGKKGENRQN